MRATTGRYKQDLTALNPRSLIPPCVPVPLLLVLLVPGSGVLGAPSVASCTLCPAGTASSTAGATAAFTCVPCAPPAGSLAGATECWPGVVSVIASNPPPLVVGYSVGDAVTLVFTSPVDVSNPPSILFLPPIGSLASTWRDGGRELVLSVVDTTGVNPAAVEVGRGHLQVSGRCTCTRLWTAKLDTCPYEGVSEKRQPHAHGVVWETPAAHYLQPQPTPVYVYNTTTHSLPLPPFLPPCLPPFLPPSPSLVHSVNPDISAICSR